ncbi:cytochrome d ubiquinol oxidase subunit II [Alistipes sp. ZOR0009]|jgi:cytochrome d ubiquinol oxidase subunit II|uniref:cytochrome d ubiquinol oxidase subunit II n=1 Tax=Alistipes sp. ZOR0009 TaxID=1339253 RepID=UPI000647E830|nr:cytochrome d ubiquinol oxidase subunit II [Alistipes sp. ZOR0009]
MEITYTFLQQYWWFIVSLLGSILVFLLFVQGGQTLMFRIGKTDEEKTMIVNSLGRKWEFTFTTLVTFGGAFFASFPLFYSTSFGGAYWVWMAILFFFVIQAVSYEYRKKPGNFLGEKTYEAFLFLNGFFGTILLGAAVATLFTGGNFFVDKMNLANIGAPTISRWANAWHGLEAVADYRNVLLGLAVFFLARTLGALYLINSIDHKTIFERSKKQVLINAIPFVLTFLGFLAAIFLSKGFAVNPDTQVVYMEPYKYFLNFIQMPILLVILLVGVVLVLWGIISTIIAQKNTKGIWFAGLGTVLTVLALLLSIGYNNTAYYPSQADLQSSLTLVNSSSSPYTLKAMSIVSILVPFVLAYIWYAWRAMNRKQITAQEMKDETHTY